MCASKVIYLNIWISGSAIGSERQTGRTHNGHNQLQCASLEAHFDLYASADVWIDDDRTGGCQTTGISCATTGRSTCGASPAMHIRRTGRRDQHTRLITTFVSVCGKFEAKYLWGIFVWYQ